MRLFGGMSRVQVVVGDEGRLESVEVDRFGLSVDLYDVALLIQAPEDSVRARVGRCKRRLYRVDPSEDVCACAELLVDEVLGVHVMTRGQRPQGLEVASKMLYEGVWVRRLISCGEEVSWDA